MGRLRLSTITRTTVIYENTGNLSVQNLSSELSRGKTTCFVDQVFAVDFIVSRATNPHFVSILEVVGNISRDDVVGPGYVGNSSAVG